MRTCDSEHFYTNNQRSNFPLRTQIVNLKNKKDSDSELKKQRDRFNEMRKI